MKKKGFTLIEMLIVIAVIGILAIAVLSAINPVEQTRKARDSRRRSNAAELLNAVERYYTTFESNPTDFAPTHTVTACSDIVGAGEVVAGDFSDLVTANEIKPEFTDRIADAADYLYVGINSTTELVSVCYEIESRANIEAYAGGDCVVSSSTYVCLPE